MWMRENTIITHPGNELSSHTSHFINGYYDGYDDCYKVSSTSPSSDRV